MADKPSVLRDTDEEARRQARVLLRGARHMALAVVQPETGFPSVSRALTGIDFDGVPVILISQLSGHTKGLQADPRCSVLAGEAGKGDPLAHARITAQCLSERVERPSREHERLRARFILRHPKAKLYVDFPDFGFWRLVPQNASLNGGFGRAYALSGEELLTAVPGDPDEWSVLAADLAGETQMAQAFAAAIGAPRNSKWRFSGVDASGVDLSAGDMLIRYEFPEIAAARKTVLMRISKATKIMYELPEI